MLIMRRSARARAAMASTTTTARGTMTGSCLPCMESSISFPSEVTVCCGRAIDGVGLTAARKIRCCRRLSAQGAAGVVGPFPDTGTIKSKSIIVVTAFCKGRAKTISDLYSFHRADGHDCLRKSSVQFVKDRFADSCRNPFDLTFDDPAGRILVFDTGFQIGGSFFAERSGRHIQRIFRNLSEIIFSVRNRDGPNGLCICSYADAHAFEKTAGNCTGGHSSDGFTSGGAPSASVVSETVFLIKGKISMSGAKAVSQCIVIPGNLIVVSYYNRNGSSGCPAFKYAG